MSHVQLRQQRDAPGPGLGLGAGLYAATASRHQGSTRIFNSRSILHRCRTYTSVLLKRLTSGRRGGGSLRCFFVWVWVTISALLIVSATFMTSMTSHDASGRRFIPGVSDKVAQFPFDSAAMVVQPKRRAILKNLTSYGIVIDKPYDAIFNEEVYEHPMWKLRWREDYLPSISPKAQALYLRMSDIWHDFMHNTSIDTLAIFEDDVHMAEPHSVPKINWIVEHTLPPNWDLFYMGRCFDRCYLDMPVAGAADLVRCWRPKCFHAWAMTKDAARVIYDEAMKPENFMKIPTDELVPNLIHDHRLIAYCAEPGLIHQDESSKPGCLGCTPDFLPPVINEIQHLLYHMWKRLERWYYND